jgi:hypothetical protein
MVLRQVIRRVRRWKLSLSLMSAAAVILVASIALAEESVPLPDFSATEAANIKGREVASKVYHSGVNFRIDPSPEIGTIYLTASDKMYRLIIRKTQCIERTGISPRALGSPLQLLSGVKVKRQSSGTGVVDGHPCKIENVEVTGKDGSTTKFKLWAATDLKGAPVKLTMHTDRGELTTTYRDIVVGTPDAALFTPPKNCIPFEKTYQVAPANK